MKEQKIRLSDRLKYRFDNFMASGPKSIFLSLILLFIIAFILTALIRTGIDIFILKQTGPENLLRDIWLSFLQITDPGAVAEDSDNPLIFKLTGILTIFLGLIFFSAVIAFITTQLDIKIEDLKKGRSRVLEEGHVIILGWNSIVVEIIRELIEANESEKNTAVVIMSDTPKEEMDEYLNEHIKERKTTRIITRTGRISSLESLNRLNITSSKSVIILPECNEAAPDEDKVISDAKVLKAVLGVVAASMNDPTRANIIAEVFDKNKRSVITNLDPEKITLVDTEKIIARIIVQTSRTTGLAFVYDSIIGFSGSEIYFYTADWGGATFSELKYHFEDGIPFGVKSQGKPISLNPPSDYLMQKGDKIVILAEDDSTIAFKKKPLFSAAEMALSENRLDKNIEKELIIGWNAKASIIIEEYADYILPGSLIDIVLPPGEEHAVEIVAELQNRNADIKISIVECDPLKMGMLREIHPEEYDNVILLNKIEEDTEKIDSTTITTLLLLKEIFSDHESITGTRVETQIISEVMDSENLELVVKTGVNDSIISYQMISKIMAQVAENPDILDVYEDLFSEEGSEIYLKPLDLYLGEVPASLTFADLMAVAEKRGEVLIGYRYKEKETSMEHNFGIEVNVPKDRVIKPKGNDCLIVVSRDEL